MLQFSSIYNFESVTAIHQQNNKRLLSGLPFLWRRLYYIGILCPCTLASQQPIDFFQLIDAFPHDGFDMPTHSVCSVKHNFQGRCSTTYAALFVRSPQKNPFKMSMIAMKPM